MRFLKVFLALFCLSLFVGMGESQAAADKILKNYISFGARVGLTVQKPRDAINLLSTGNIDADRTSSFCGGLNLSLGLGNRLKFRLETELLYTRNSAKFSNPEGSVTAKYNYLSVPFNIQWLVMGNTFYFVAGPEFSYTLSRKLVEEGLNDYNFRNTDLVTGLNLGFGVSVLNLDFTLKYHYDVLGNEFSGIRMMVGLRFFRLKGI